MDRMGTDELIYTINMVFPYIHREQILIWNRIRYQLQNTNPFHNAKFMESLAE
jgi:hypothetical protein